MAKAKPIRIGLVGIGRAGWAMHCKELEGREKKFHIVAACDLEKSRRDKMAEKYGCRTYKDVDDLIADEDVELVDIATRSCDHFDHASRALKAGKIVFLEKPMTVTYDEAKKLKELTRKSKGKLFIRHNRRFEPTFQHIRELIDEGRIGEVHEIKLHRDNYQRRDDWQTLIEFGGGQLLNWGPHIIDHALRLLDAPVAELWSDLKNVAAVGDAEDHLKIVFRGKNGRVIDLEISGGKAIKEPTYVLHGDKGSIEVGADNMISLRYLNPQQKLRPRRPKKKTPPEGGFGSPDKLKWVEKKLVPKSPTNDDMHSIWDYLYSAIREGKKYPISLDEALEVMWVVDQVKNGTPFEYKPRTDTTTTAKTRKKSTPKKSSSKKSTRAKKK